MILAISFRVNIHEVIDQQVKVMATVSQGRKRDGDDFQTIVEVGPERAIPCDLVYVVYELPFRPNLGSREPIVYRGYSFVSQYITSLFPRLKKRKRESCGDGFEGGRSILS